MSHNDPESFAMARESAQRGEFEVQFTLNGEHVGKLDDTFDNDFDAGYAAHEHSVPDIGLEAEVVDVTDESARNDLEPVLHRP